MLLCISRATFEELKQREYGDYTEWKNTANDNLCTHCIRIVSIRLCIDEITEYTYWKYMKATPLERQLMHEKCVEMYFDLFEDYIELGGEL